jgi:hypothetical protein
MSYLAQKTKTTIVGGLLVLCIFISLFQAAPADANGLFSKPIFQPFSLLQASILSFFQGIPCFFGFNCVNEPEKTTIQPLPQNHSANGQELASINSSAGETGVSSSLTLDSQKASLQDGSIFPEKSGKPSTKISEKTPAPITQVVNPTKEIQTVRTVVEHTNTVVVDEDTKNKVNQLARQLDSDRPNFSVGQSYSLPADLGGETLRVNSGGFTVDKSGNVNAQTIAAAGNLTVQGNFTVAGAQTYSGAAAFNATSTVPALAVSQTGSGLALLADSI